MYFSQAHPDAGSITGWYRESEPKEAYKRTEIPKIPILLASLIEKDAEFFKDVLKKEDWKLVCWYPSCHGPMENIKGKSQNAYNIHLYVKKQEADILDTRQPEGHFPLSCSVYLWNQFSKVANPYDPVNGLLGYAHGIIGIRRVPLKTEVDEKEVAPWFKFATTELATYWAWGLKPGEKDIYALEPNLRPAKSRREHELLQGISRCGNDAGMV